MKDLNFTTKATDFQNIQNKKWANITLPTFYYLNLILLAI